jgi:hypothetical protein
MKYLGCSLLTVLLVGSVLAQHKITLDTPVQARAGASEFSLSSFSFDQAGKQLVIGFREVGGDRSLTFTYSGDDFDSAFRSFVDTALENRIIQRLQTDGKLGSGTVTGVPE